MGAPQQRRMSSPKESSARQRALSLPHWTFALASTGANDEEQVESPRAVVLSRGRSATIANSLLPEVHGLLSSGDEPADEPAEGGAESAEVAEPDLYTVCCCKMSGNAVSLLTMAVAFGSITAVQFVFATIAHSLALQADCMSMGIDTLTYLASLMVECMPFASQRQKQKMEFAMAGISYFILLALTLMFIYDGIVILEEAGGDDGSKASVDGRIVIAFASAGIIFDVGTLIVYKKVAHEGNTETESDESTSQTCGINVNVCAALAHVLSDTFRSTTTFIEGLIILTRDDIDSAEADGIATLVVCTIIAVGTVGAIVTWLIELKALLAAGDISKQEVELESKFDEAEQSEDVAV